MALRMIKGKSEKIRTISIFVMCFLYFSLMILVADALYQTFKDFYYNTACIILMLALMLIRKDFKIHKLATVPAIFVFLGAVNYMYDTRNNWGIELKRVLFTRFVLYTVIVLFLLSLFFNRARIIEYKRTICGVLCLLFVFGAAALDYEDLFKTAFPLMLILFAGRINKDELKKLTDLIALSLYATFFVFMTISLIIHPERSNVGRYEGIFFFPIVTGLLSSMGVISSMHFIYKMWGDKDNSNVVNNKIVKYIPIVMFLYAAIMLISSTNRAVLLGLLVVMTAYIIFLIFRANKTIKIIVTALLLTVIVSGSIGINWMAHNFSPDAFIAKHNISMDNILYYFIDHLPSVQTYSSTGVFEPGSVLNSLDRMSSDRLGIWVAGLRQATLFGKNETAVTLPTGFVYGHVHSTLIDWIMRYGAIVGSIGLIWLVASVIRLAYDFFKRREKWSLAFWWVAFSLGVFLVEKECWAELLPMTVILFQYRFFYGIDEGEGGDNIEEIVTKE